MWSDLTQIIEESPNCSSREGRKVERITVHHTAGKNTAQGLLNEFRTPWQQGGRKASANYVIGNDGTIGGCVLEELRAWTSGSKENDTRAITIEVSNDVNGEPWSMIKNAWNSAVALCADICLRYGFKLWWNPDRKTGSLTCHRWFQATACPGDWFYSRIPQFMNEVNNMVDRIIALEKAVKKLQEENRQLADRIGVVENFDVVAARSLDILDERTKEQYQSVKECPSWAKPTIEKLVKAGDLKGDGDGLGLTTDLTRTLVIVDRAGGFDKK